MNRFIWSGELPAGFSRACALAIKTPIKSTKQLGKGRLVRIPEGSLITALAGVRVQWRQRCRLLLRHLQRNSVATQAARPPAIPAFLSPAWTAATAKLEGRHTWPVFPSPVRSGPRPGYR